MKIPIVDEHNRMRQNIIGLERKRRAKDCRFFVGTTTGLSVVRTHQWHRSMKFKGAPNSLILRRQHETNNFETRCDYEIEVAKLTNTL